MKLRILGLWIVATVVGCADEPFRGPRPPRPEEIPAAVAVAGGAVELGFAIGRARTVVEVAAFEISLYPITVGRYRECIEAGACSTPALDIAACRGSTDEPTSATFSASEDARDLALTCVAPNQAAAYCAWIGARLPGAAEWLVAARGPAVHRFAWGDAAATCERHPLGPPEGPGATCATATLEIDRYPTGASPVGLADVLLTSGELTRVAPGEPVLACAANEGACVVGGIEPGAIDGFRRLPPEVAAADVASRVAPFGFRCVKDGGAR